MPVSVWRNRLYRMALPFLGLRTQGSVHCSTPIDQQHLDRLNAIFHRHHVVGACLQLVQKGALGPLITYGCARLPQEPAIAETIYRIASITKMVTAAGAMILSERRAIDLDAPADDYLPYPLRNPSFPDRPILVRHLLSHTSSIWDGPGYEHALHSPVPLKTLVEDSKNFLHVAPNETFRYSNLAAGIIGSIMEHVTGRSLETLMQEMVFSPLGMQATYTLKNVGNANQVAPIYRVMPKGSGEPIFDPNKRQKTSDDMLSAAPEYHYLPAAGNLFTDGASLGKLVCMLSNGGHPLLSSGSIATMRTPIAAYGKHAPHASHCLGLVAVDDSSLGTGRLYGHQGFAYGACQGVFFDESTGNGIVFLNNGASEARKGHLAMVNRDLILWCLGKNGCLFKNT